jgi:hypothetical protein
MTDPPQRDSSTETGDTGTDDADLKPIAGGSGAFSVHGVRL